MKKIENDRNTPMSLILSSNMPFQMACPTPLAMPLRLPSCYRQHYFKLEVDLEAIRNENTLHRLHETNFAKTAILDGRIDWDCITFRLFMRVNVIP